MGKRALNLLIEVDLVEKARQNGIVISKFLENKLQEHFQFMDAIGYGKRMESPPYDNNPIPGSKESFSLSKSNNLSLDKGTSLRACGVAWYPCGFGSHRLAFKSQQAHYLLREKSLATEPNSVFSRFFLLVSLSYWGKAMLFIASKEDFVLAWISARPTLPRRLALHTV